MMTPPPHVQAWIDFLATVEVVGPIPITFSVFLSAPPAPQWILRSQMLVPDRDAPEVCAGCERLRLNRWIIIQNELPAADDPTPKEIVIRQRVLGHFQHEGLESILIGGRRAFDPHEQRWYSSLVADWRYVA